MPVLNAGWEEGRLPNMTNGHVFVWEPVNQVPCLQYGIGYILFIKIHTDCVVGVRGWGGEGGWGGGGGVGTIGVKLHHYEEHFSNF